MTTVVTLSVELETLQTALARCVDGATWGLADMESGTTIQMVGDDEGNVTLTIHAMGTP